MFLANIDNKKKCSLFFFSLYDIESYFSYAKFLHTTEWNSFSRLEFQACSDCGYFIIFFFYIILFFFSLNPNFKSNIELRKTI